MFLKLLKQTLKTKKFLAIFCLSTVILGSFLNNLKILSQDLDQTEIHLEVNSLQILQPSFSILEEDKRNLVFVLNEVFNKSDGQKVTGANCKIEILNPQDHKVVFQGKTTDSGIYNFRTKLSWKDQELELVEGNPDKIFADLGIGRAYGIIEIGNEKWISNTVNYEVTENSHIQILNPESIIFYNTNNAKNIFAKNSLYLEISPSFPISSCSISLRPYYQKITSKNFLPEKKIPTIKLLGKGCLATIPKEMQVTPVWDYQIRLLDKQKKAWILSETYSLQYGALGSVDINLE